MWLAMKIKEKTMEELELFEAASKDLFDTMQGFKDNLSVQFPLLDSDNWQYDKGSIKVCKADESGLKKDVESESATTWKSPY